MSRKQESVISLDPIDRSRKKQNAPLPRLFKTRWSGGKRPSGEIPFGHYMFCGKQGAGKTASALWYCNFLQKKYKKVRGKDKKFHEVKWQIYSNLGYGKPVTRATMLEVFKKFTSRDENPYEFRIILIDEIQSYFPRDFSDKEGKIIMKDLVGCFSQLRKRNTFVLSTAQVYGRLDKTLREQCLFMVSCRKSFTGRLLNDFIPGDDIMCDEMGRWSGVPTRIYSHGLSKIRYNTAKIILE